MHSVCVEEGDVNYEGFMASVVDGRRQTHLHVVECHAHGWLGVARVDIHDGHRVCGEAAGPGGRSR